MADHIDGQRCVYKNNEKIAAALPGVVDAFFKLHHEALKDGALSPATKELISLGIAIAVHCEGCIDCHVDDALKHGATAEQIAETVGVAMLMGGGPSMVYGGKALEALEQFQAKG